MKRLLLLFSLLLLSGCAAFPLLTENKGTQSLKHSKVVLEIDPVVKHENGENYFQLDNNVIEHAKKAFAGCEGPCENETKVNLQFLAHTNSGSGWFRVWQWAGFLTLGIIPVDEVTEFTLIAKVGTPGGQREFKLKKNRHLVMSIFLLPLNVFRSWEKDLNGAQEQLIDSLASELEGNSLSGGSVIGGAKGDLNVSPQ